MPAPSEEIDPSAYITTSYSPEPPSKCLETRDSISSIDSSLSLSFDKPTNNPQTEDEGAHTADSDSASDTASNSGGKDSGCEVTPEVTEPPFTPPSDELSEKIIQQVEFYFSDANISKDAFLLKHVKRNKEGFVSLKLISSFKRVKHITKDWRVVAYALKNSKKLEINEAGTKLRRLEALPKYDETTPSRTVVACNMPIEKPTIENVAELFKACGEIALIRILRPGNPIPADVRQFINKNPSLAGIVCALVEFVNSESARNALQIKTFKVYELNAIPHPERKKKTQKKKPVEETEVEEKTKPHKLRRGSSAHFPQKNLEPAAWLQRRLSASSTEANFMFVPRRLSYSSRDSSESSLFMSRRVSASSIGSGEMGFVQRRMSACSLGSSDGGRSRSNSAAFQNENVVRLPKGPDGSKGFRQRVSLGTIHS